METGGCYINNCSIKNIKIKTTGNQATLIVGGILGNSENTTISNSFVTGLDLEVSIGVKSGVGGLVGYGNGALKISNCYTEGKIKSQGKNVGGIAGYLNVVEIDNCYSKVNISTTNDNVGGIVGNLNSGEVNNNISIGNIYTTSGLNALNRIVGNITNTINSNYAYENQLLNGYNSDETKGATLLRKEGVLNLNLGESYNYDKREEEILPKLYNEEGTILLPNQEDIFLDDSKMLESIDLEVENIQATKPNTTEAEVTVKIKNPTEIKITGILIEDMQIMEIIRNVTQNGVTSITVRSMPTRYYDSYKLVGIQYKTDNSQEQKTKEVENEVKVQFYKEIYTYEDWQSIEEGTYQNYRLMADIDFNGKSNVKNNITVNRLEAENNVYTLKNITLEFNEGNTGLINNIKTSIKNIAFENIMLTNTAQTENYFGVIATSSGEIVNIKFKDITIKAPKLLYVGSIGGINSGNIKNVDINNVWVSGNSSIGSMIGYAENTSNSVVENITAKVVNISGNYYCGGVLGNYRNSNSTINNVHIEESDISGAKDYTGGIAGYFSGCALNTLEAKSVEITGGRYVGGIAGAASSCETKYVMVNESNIVGETCIGGAFGSRGTNNLSYVSVNETSIIGSSSNSSYVGGVVGQCVWSSTYYAGVTNSIIKNNGEYTGGITNSLVNSIGTASIGYGFVENTEISRKLLCGRINRVWKLFYDS